MTHPKVITQKRIHVLGTVEKRRLYLKHFPDNLALKFGWFCQTNRQ